MSVFPVAVDQQRRWTGSQSLWAHADFLRLFASQSVSLFGSEITLIALPLTAVLVLGASPAQMGLLAALEKVPFLLVGLFAGVWVDRLRYRSVLVTADFGRALLLGSVPVAAALGVLSMGHLMLVALLAGVLTVFFDVAYQSVLPELVHRSQLADGNSKLEASKSIAEMAGPMLGSALLQIAAAPFAIGIDALSFVFSGVFLRSIRASSPPAPHAARAGMLTEVGVGIRLVLRHPVLRPIAACSATMNLFFQMLSAVYILYVTTELQLPPALIGVVFGLGSLAALAGAVVASRLGKRIGIGRTLMLSTIVSGLAGLSISVVQPGELTLAALVGAQCLLMLGVPVYNINQLTLRQSITPAAVRGRVNATNRCLVWGTMPVGSLLGGLLGEAIGLQTTIAVAAGGMVLAAVWIATSQLRGLSNGKLEALAELA
jgi:MFS family permease